MTTSTEEALENRIFSIDNEPDFEQLSLDIFRFQFENNPVYRQFCRYLERTPGSVNSTQDIPFLPIRFFKSHLVSSTSGPYDKIFESSGTTGQTTSKHHVKSLPLYERAAHQGFMQHYGEPGQLCFLALLPGYAERANSSLIHMVSSFLALNNQKMGGFFLDDFDALEKQLSTNEVNGIQSILLGVSHALLSFAEQRKMNLKNTLVMETGGMKGRRKEITRHELHHMLQESFGVDHIHSEYGMTELMSQAYARKNGIFTCPPWMRVLIRETTDPLSRAEPGAAGGINIIDLANVHSCSFVATDDLGRAVDQGFEVLGRLDNSDIRGCNLMLY